MQANDIVIDVNEADFQIEVLEERLEMVALSHEDFQLEVKITCCQ